MNLITCILTDGTQKILASPGIERLFELLGKLEALLGEDRITHRSMRDVRGEGETGGGGMGRIEPTHLSILSQHFSRLARAQVPYSSG